MKVFNWIFAIFCILCLPVFGFHAGSVFMCLLGIVSLPVKPVKKIWNMLPKSKILRPVIIGSLFVIFCYMIPTDSNQSDIVAEISTESSEIIQGSEAVKNEPSETEKNECENEVVLMKKQADVWTDNIREKNNGSDMLIQEGDIILKDIKGDEVDLFFVDEICFKADETI